MPKMMAYEPTLAMVARESLTEAEGDALRATDIMIKRVMSNTSLYKMLMDPLVKNACCDAIMTQCGRQRRSMWDSIQPSANAFRERVKALVRILASDFDLTGSKIGVSDAVRDERAADITQKQAGDSTARNPPKKRVRRNTRSKALS